MPDRSLGEVRIAIEDARLGSLRLRDAGDGESGAHQDDLHAESPCGSRGSPVHPGGLTS
jgi:hypothetical protein